MFTFKYINITVICIVATTSYCSSSESSVFPCCRVIHENALYSVFKLEYTAEEEVDEYESPLLWQKRPIILDVRVHSYVPVQREHLAQHLNQQVRKLLVRRS